MDKKALINSRIPRIFKDDFKENRRWVPLRNSTPPDRLEIRHSLKPDLRSSLKISGSLPEQLLVIDPTFQTAILRS